MPGFLADARPRPAGRSRPTPATGSSGATASARPDLEALAPEVDRLRAEAVRLGGNLTLPRCPTAWKDRLRVWGEPRGDWAIAEKVKAALDPAGVLNPGRFVGKI